jgi:hypothetical protein
MTERHPAEQFNPAKCRLHRFSGFYGFCSFSAPTPIQTIWKSHFHRKQRVLVPALLLGGPPCCPLILHVATQAYSNQPDHRCFARL